MSRLAGLWLIGVEKKRNAQLSLGFDLHIFVREQFMNSVDYSRNSLSRSPIHEKVMCLRAVHGLFMNKCLLKFDLQKTKIIQILHIF